jgi:hypothetical protein
MKPCRECEHQISEQAFACPNCGAPYPAREQWDGWGYEYKSNTTILGLPLLHISFKYRIPPGHSRGLPVPAKGIIAIGQFACGVFTISQVGIGVISISQFTIAGFALSQFAAAYSLVAQFGLYIHQGHGQVVKNILELIDKLI